MKIFQKKKYENGNREIYFCGLKIFTYKSSSNYQKRVMDYKLINEKRIQDARNLGVKIGENVELIGITEFGTEPYFIEIGNNTLISFGVVFLTHDGCVHACKPYVKNPNNIRKVGRIKIGDWCFIGCGSTILPGVTIGNNCVIGASSVVTKSIPDGEVWAGNPAKFICKIEDLAKKKK